MSSSTASFAAAREELLALVQEIRPELHRYCARLTGSVITGEDIVQDVLAKALYALTLEPEMPALRPWLFRIAHNAAIDHLKRHDHARTEPRAELEVVSAADERPDPATVRAALSRFLDLSVVERSAVILKDVLGHSVDEVAATMGTTVAAVKAALVRGRTKLREPSHEAARGLDAGLRDKLDAYARLFNARDWDGVRVLIGEDCQLDLVSKSHRRGKAVGMYFDRYAKENVHLEVRRLGDHLVLAAFVDGAAAPSYFMTLEWAGDRVQTIRDFRYVPYIVVDAELEPA